MKKVICLIILIYMTSFVTNASAIEIQSVQETTLPTGGYTPFVPELITIDEAVTQHPDFYNTPNLYNINLLSIESETEVNPSEYYGLNVLKALDLRNGNTLFTDMYIAVSQGMSQMSTRIQIGSIGDITINDFNMVFEACINDNPQFYYYNLGYYPYGYVGSQYIAYIEPLYTDNRTPEDVAAFEAAADKIITSAKITDEMTDYEKALALHDELAYHIEYNEDITAASKLTDPDEYQAAIEAAMEKYPYMHSAYGALVEGNAVCDGYTRAYQYLLYKVGILSHIATGTANGGGHAWNAVRLDGEWYYTDIAWNDQTSGIYYSYFNITSERIGLDHIATNRYPLPLATSEDDNYYVKNTNYVLSTQNEATVISTVAEQFKNSISARVYAPDYSISNMASWVNKNISSMIPPSGDDRLSSYYCTLMSPLGGEYHIIFTKVNRSSEENLNTIYADKDFYVSVMDMTGENNVLMQAFYDEDGVVSKIRFKNLSSQPNHLSVQFLHPPSDFDNFSSVSYFLWSDGNIKPITNYFSLEY